MAMIRADSPGECGQGSVTRWRWFGKHLDRKTQDNRQYRALSIATTNRFFQPSDSALEPIHLCLLQTLDLELLRRIVAAESSP
jgi:hypothetical protein